METETSCRAQLICSFLYLGYFLCCGMKKHLLILWHCFSWLQIRHKIRVVGGRPVVQSMMSATLVQSIKCIEVKGNFNSMEKCWCSVHNPHPCSSPSDINCTLFLSFFKKASCWTVYRPADGYRHLNTDTDTLKKTWFATHYCLLEASGTEGLSTFNSILAWRWSQKLTNMV